MSGVVDQPNVALCRWLLAPFVNIPLVLFCIALGCFPLWSQKTESIIFQAEIGHHQRLSSSFFVINTCCQSWYSFELTIELVHIRTVPYSTLIENVILLQTGTGNFPSRVGNFEKKILCALQTVFLLCGRAS